MSRSTASLSQSRPSARRMSAGARLLAFVLVAALLVAGIFVLGRISDNATVSMGLTAVWFGLVFVVAAGLAFRRRELALPLAAGYGAVAIAAAVLVIAPTLFDKEVDEQVVTGTPAGQAPAPAERDNDNDTAQAPPQGNVQVAAGRFGSVAHAGTGDAAVVELPSGERKLTLTDFETDAGPDLRVYVSTGDPAGGDLGGFRDLGALKGNIGNQQYSVPKSVNLDRYSTVVVWCRAFSVAFTSAPLRQT